jgi:hypothetical protein
MGWTTEFKFPVGEISFFFFFLRIATASRPALGLTQPPIQRVPGEGLLARIKQPVCEADHSSLSSCEVKNAWSYTSIHPVCLHGVLLN